MPSAGRWTRALTRDCLYTRQFMLLDLQKLLETKRGSAGHRLTRWSDRYFEPCASYLPGLRESRGRRD